MTVFKGSIAFMIRRMSNRHRQFSKSQKGRDHRDLIEAALGSPKLQMLQESGFELAPCKGVPCPSELAELLDECSQAGR